MIRGRGGPLRGVLPWIAVLACLTGCPQDPAITRHGIVNDQEYATYRLAGSAVIEGQVVVEVPGRGTFYGADGQVLLLPRVSENDRYVRDVVLPGKISLPDPHIDQVTWATSSDAQGRFRFDGLPAGNYYVVCPVAWVATDGTPQQAMALGQVGVADGQQGRVIVTRGQGN